MFEEGITRQYPNGDDLSSSFMTGVSTMFVGTTGYLKSFIDAADFDLGITYLTNASGEFNGSLIGGNSIWLSDSTPEEEKEGAWEFIQYLMSGETQAFLSAKSGYFPINPKALDHQIMVDVLNEYPDFIMGIDQLNNSVSTVATSRALINIFPEVREHVVLALEKMYNQVDTYENIMDELVSKSNADIERYNMLNN